MQTAANFLDIALQHIARGWYVHPLKPSGKRPITDHGKNDATLAEAQVRAWWTRTPNANVGVSCGPSGLCVLDADHGLKDKADFIAWRDRNGLPVTYAVRSGRRPEFGVQSYYAGGLRDGKFELDGVTGEIKSLGGLVMSVGNIHPDTGETYQLLVDAPLAPVPAIIEQSRKRAEATAATRKPGELITENRNMELVSRVGKFRAAIPGASEESTLSFMQQWNLEACADPMSCDEVEETTRKQFRLYPDTEETPEVVIGQPEEKTVTDWREHYHSAAEHDSVGPPRYLIEWFLPEQAIMGIGAFVGQKKTLAALNIVFSLCSGEPLFGRYKVTRKPARVLYLGPENGLMSFSNRVNSIGLRDYLCKNFFYSTMSMQEHRPLVKLLPEEIQDAAIVIDTAIRFTDGSENDAAMMKEFAKHAFSLIRNKAACVIMLHHSPKSMTQSNELTLENSFRGTGELSAFLSVALAMRTQDMHHEYESASLLRFVKQRDFEPKPSSFEVTTDRKTCRMTFVDGSDGATVTVGNTANKDGKDDAAVALMKANPKLSGVKMSKLLEDAGIHRSKEWVRLKRGELGIGGVTVGSSP